MSKYTGDPIPILGGYLRPILPLFKWRRPEGLASFLRDRIALRKSLALCATCERKMPRSWLEQYDYALIRGYHMEDTGCDYCRDIYSTTNLYMPGEGDYYRQWKLGTDSVRETRARDQKRAQEDQRFLVGFH